MVINIIVSFCRREGLGEASARVKVTQCIGLYEDSTCGQERDIGHEQERVRDVWDAENGYRGEDVVKGIKGLSLRSTPGPREILVSEEDYLGDNV